MAEGLGSIFRCVAIKVDTLRDNCWTSIIGKGGGAGQTSIAAKPGPAPKKTERCRSACSNIFRRVNKMRFSCLLLPAGAVLAGMAMAARPSQALTFDFSFTSVAGPGTVAGTVAGVIAGLTDNGTNEIPTSFYLTSEPAALQNAIDFVLLGDNLLTAYGWTTQADTFTVSGGSVVSYDLNLYNIYGDSIDVDNSVLNVCDTDNQCADSSNVTFSLAPAETSMPEPMTISLLGVGLLGLVATRLGRVVYSLPGRATASPA